MTVEPGLHFRLPYGIDAVTVLPTRRQLKLEFGFTSPTPAENPSRQHGEICSTVKVSLCTY